jgi:hypothetical protein
VGDRSIDEAGLICFIIFGVKKRLKSKNEGPIVFVLLVINNYRDI